MSPLLAWQETYFAYKWQLGFCLSCDCQGHHFLYSNDIRLACPQITCMAGSSSIVTGVNKLTLCQLMVWSLVNLCHLLPVEGCRLLAILHAYSHSLLLDNAVANSSFAEEALGRSWYKCTDRAKSDQGFRMRRCMCISCRYPQACAIFVPTARR